MIAPAVILILLAVFIAVLLIRTARFRPKAEPMETIAPVDFDRQAAIDALQKLIRCRTVSYSITRWRTTPNLKSSSAFCRSCIPRSLKPAPLPDCRTGASCSSGPARPTKNPPS